MKTYAIVAAASFNAEHFRMMDQRDAFSQVIAVDGGFSYLQELGRAADAVLGDFDSLGYVPDHERVMRHNPHKDASDLELAVDVALGEGAQELYVYGCLAGRLDHTVAALHQLARAAEAGVQATGVGEGFAVRALAGPGRFSIPEPQARCGAQPGADTAFLACESKGGFGTVSVFAAGDEARGVTEEGLEYPLENAVLGNRTSLGLSNELTGRPASVSVESGTVYVFYPL